MQTKHYFHELTEREKKFYFTTEIYAADPKVRFYMAVVVVAVASIDLILRLLIYPLIEDGESYPLYKPAIVPLISCVLSFVLCIVTVPKLSGKHLNRLRFYMRNITVLCGGSYYYLMIYDSLTRALKTKEAEDWTFSLISMSNCIHQSAIILTVTPTWAYTVFNLACSYAAVITVYIQSDEPLKGWVLTKSIANIFYMTAYVGVNFYTRWKAFLKSSEAEAWNQVYNDTLDRIPSSIAVMNVSGQLIYSNSEFKKISEDNPQKLFRSVINLKLRDTSAPQSICEGFLLKVPHEEFTMASSRNQFPGNTSRNSYHMLRNKDTTCISPRFCKLEDLLEYYRSLLRNNELKNEEPVIYDSKLEVRTLYGHFISSYEVIVRPLVENKKIVIILNNTTQRDIAVSSEDNNDYKDKVLASISHELRTPLNGNLVLLQAAVQEENVPKAVKEKLLIPALRSGRLLSHLINDILDYSTMLSDKITLCCETRPLRESLEYCCQLLEHVFKAKQLKFNLVVDSSVPHLFCTDHQRLIQVLLNLLSNALKFTFNGGVTVEAKVTKENPSAVEISVNDTGIGITREALSVLFEEDPQLTSRTSREVLPSRKDLASKGVGLGLKVASKLTLTLGPEGGKGLQVKSVDGEGSSFSFKIVQRNIEEEEDRDRDEEQLMDEFEKSHYSLPEVPYELVEDGKHVSVEKFKRSKFKSAMRKFSSKVDVRRKEIGSSSRRIGRALIVDDDLINIMALETLLKQLKVSADSAYNGKQALDKVLTHSEKYQIIFMDCQMPIMDGFEATRQLVEKMKSEEIPTIPIIGCTAFSAKNKIEECIKSGMAEVINKPVLKEKLKRIIDKYIS